MKRYFCIILLMLAGIRGAFGEGFSLSAGAGGILGGVFTRYTLSASGLIESPENELEFVPISIKAGQEMNQINYGFFAFFDASYGILSVFYLNGANNFRETADISGLDNNVDKEGKGWESVLGISLLGKYPFVLNNRLTVFPLLGMDFQLCLKQRRTQADGWVYDRNDGLREKDKDYNAYLLKDWNSWWVNLGGGLDITLTGKFFLRSEFLYGFRLMTSYEKKNLELMKSQANDPKPKLGGLTSGPSVRLSVGYRFF